MAFRHLKKNIFLSATGVFRAIHSMEHKLALSDKNLEDFLTISEIKVGFDAFTEAQWIKLGKTANNLCRGLPIEGADLLHIVICRALEGRRRCRRELPMEVFIYHAMESVVDAFIKRRKSDPLENTIHPLDSEDAIELMDMLDSRIGTPEEEMIANQTLQALKQLFEGDERSMEILTYQMDNLQPAEIQKLMELTPVQYASALKAIRRKYDKLGLQGIVMTKQSKQSIEQLFNIAKAVSHQVIKLPDREVLDEDNDSFTKSEGFMAKRAYLKALQTVGAKDTKQVEPKVPSFNLANTLMKGVSVKVARQKLMGLNAANDPSLQLIANSANLLNDEEILKTYQALLSAGLLDIG